MTRFFFYQAVTILVAANSFLAGTKAASADTWQNPFFTSSSRRYKNAVVERVISADTIRLESGEKIKLIGLRAPEIPRRRKAERDKFGFIIEEENPLTSVEEKAFDFVRSLLEGETVRMEFDVQKKSRDLSTFAYVFLIKKKTFVNTEILKQGFAFLQIRPPNTKYAQDLRDAYKEARREKRGLQGE